jgi:1-acyl-sn-glycerol-3-phosphate acyltransferase
LLYRILKFFAPLALHFYCRQLRINHIQWCKTKGPVLLAANHPNSFLDAILLCTIFQQPVYSLARGDAFKHSWVAKLLMHLHMFPVYRLSEGSENVTNNYDTFDNCIGLFKQKKIVLIFSEGLCVNEWHLRKLKKGTARLALAAWKQGIPLTVLPVGINYSSFIRFGKNIHLHFGQPIGREMISLQKGEGVAIRQFNHALWQQLQLGVYEIPANDKAMQKKLFAVTQPLWKKLLLALPAILGVLLHAPLFWMVKSIYRHTIKDADHYDSVMVGLLFIIYPILLFLLFGVLVAIGKLAWALLVVFVLPFTAWSYVQLKPQF